MTHDLNDIEYYNSYEKIAEYRNTLYEWFNQYDFEWFVTMRLPNKNVENAEKFLKIWRCSLCTRNHIQICYFGIIVTSKFTKPHIHLLVSGKNKHEQTLRDMESKQWEREWSAITKKDCHIEPVRDSGVNNYIASPKNTPLFPFFELVRPYNKDLLQKYEKYDS